MEDRGKQLRKRLSNVLGDIKPPPKPDIPKSQKKNSMPEIAPVDPLKFYESQDIEKKAETKEVDPLKFVAEHSTSSNVVYSYSDLYKGKDNDHINLYDDPISRANIEATKKLENEKLNEKNEKDEKKDVSNDTKEEGRVKVSRENKPKKGFINYSKYDYVKDLNDEDYKKLEERVNIGIDTIKGNIQKEKEVKVSEKIVKKSEVVEKKINNNVSLKPVGSTTNQKPNGDVDKKKPTGGVENAAGSSVLDRIKNLQKNVDKNQPKK